MNMVEFAMQALSVPFLDKGRSMEGFDCFGLVVCCYKQVFDIELPKLTDEYADSGLSSESRDEIGRLISREKIEWLKQDWTQVNNYEPGDVVLFTLGGSLVHCGVMVNKRNFVHTEKKVGTCIESLNSAMWNRRIEGVYRMAKVICPKR